jgi:hypothetical protein
LLQIIFLNLTLDGVAFCPERRKPFDLSTEELPLEKIRGDKAAIELFMSCIRGWEGDVRKQFDQSRTF